MRKLRFIAFALFILVAGVACEHRPLVDPAMAHYVRVYLDEKLLNINTGIYNEDYIKPNYRQPNIMKVVLYNRETGQYVTDRFLRNKDVDVKGTYFDGYIACPAGDYVLLAYSYGTEATIVGNETNIYEAEAYTNPISLSLAGFLPFQYTSVKRVNMPDMFFSTSEALEIKYNAAVDTLKRTNGEYFVAHPKVETYFIQIRIKNMQYLQSASALLSGMRGRAPLYGLNNDKEPVEIYFDLYEDGITGDAILYATFNTFGKIGGYEDEIKLSLNLIRKDNQSYTARIDISDAFMTVDAISNHWVFVDSGIEIPVPPVSEGGFTPAVQDWVEISAEIII